MNKQVKQTNKNFIDTHKIQESIYQNKQSMKITKSKQENHLSRHITFFAIHFTFFSL